jgi:hypothetical protein
MYYEEAHIGPNMWVCTSVGYDEWTTVCGEYAAREAASWRLRFVKLGWLRVALRYFRFSISVSDFRSLSAARLIGFSGAAFFYRGQHTSWVG